MRGFKWPVILLIGLMTLTQAEAQTQVPSQALPKKFIWIWLEDAIYSEMIQQTFVKSLVKRNNVSRSSNYVPVSPVMQANAFALIAGDTFGISDNALTRVFAPSLVNLLEAKKIPWRVYAEDFPGQCFTGVANGAYQRARVPFLSLAQVQSDRFLCNKVVNASKYEDDFNTGFMPAFTVVIPAKRGDPKAEDRILEKYLKPWTSDFELMKDTLILVTNVSLKNPNKEKGFFLVMGKKVKNGLISNKQVQHYQVLKTIQKLFSLNSLNAQDELSEPLQEFWSIPLELQP